jgi:uncharacterized protein YybS (DUF2232 family)
VSIKSGNSGLTVNALTEGALMAALAALLGILGIYIPALALLTGLVWAIPIILLIMRHNLKVGIMGLVVSGFLISILAGPVQGFLLIINLGGMALAYGYCFKNQVSPLKTLFIGTVIAAVSTALVIILSAFAAGLPIAEWHAQFKQAINEAFKVYQEGMLEKILPSGVTPEEYKQQLFRFIDTMLPGVFVSASMGIALVNYLIARRILIKLRYDIPEIPPFRHWHFPWYIVWGVILGLILLLAGNHYGNQVMGIIGKNILYIYYPLLLISGISVVVYFWKKTNLSGPVKAILLIGVIMFMHILFFVVLLLGLFDPLFDYRRMMEDRTSPHS